MKEFNVISSNVRFDRAYFRKRDKSNMQQLFLIVYSNYINLYNFIKNIGFLYNAKRKKSSLIALNKIESKAKEELHKVKQYDKVLRLRKKGLSAYKIANKLNLKNHLVKYWLYYGGKPILHDYVRKLSNS